MSAPSGAPALGREHRIGVALGIILSIVTCGLYNIYWNYRQFLAMNELLGRQEFNFFKWLLLTPLTCGIYHVYSEYHMGTELYGWLRANGRDPGPNMPVLGLALSCFGLTVLADAVYQHELNKLT